jgi:hypothetical protein
MSLLQFYYNNNVTLRTLLGDIQFKRLVHTLVGLNHHDMRTNVLLLDKVCAHEEVVKLFVQIQKVMIDQYKPH